MRPFARDVGVDVFARSSVDFLAGSSSHDADAFRFHRSRANAADGAAYRLFEPIDQFIAPQSCFCDQPGWLSFQFEKWLGLLEPKCRGEERVIAQTRMQIERQMD